MTGKSTTRDSRFFDQRREFLAKFQRPVIKWAALVVGPISFAMFLYRAMDAGGWHNWTRFYIVAVMCLSWVFAYRNSVTGKLEISVRIAIVSIIGMEGAELMLVKGTELATILGLFGMIAYAALFSRKYLWLTIVATSLLVIASEVVKLIGLYEVQMVTGVDRIIDQVLFTLILMPLFGFIMRKHQTINDALFGDLGDRNARQGQIIETANRIQPVMDDVIHSFEEMATSFATQASEQAASTAEVKSAMDRVRAIASQTAQTASETQGIGDRTRDDSLRSRSGLVEVERGFNEVSDSIGDARATMAELSGMAGNIGEILDYNREISERIKVLAINAAIQAAEAGQHGAGFRVVAEELRSMIQDIEENYQRSYDLLRGIQARAEDGSDKISESAGVLEGHVRNLARTRETVEGIVDGFVDTSERVGLITDGARRQSSSLVEIDAAIEQIATAAGQLESSGGILMDGLRRISDSQDELREVLASGDLR